MVDVSPANARKADAAMARAAAAQAELVALYSRIADLQEVRAREVAAAVRADPGVGPGRVVADLGVSRPTARKLVRGQARTGVL